MVTDKCRGDKMNPFLNQQKRIPPILKNMALFREEQSASFLESL